MDKSYRTGCAVCFVVCVCVGTNVHVCGCAAASEKWSEISLLINSNWRPCILSVYTTAVNDPRTIPTHRCECVFVCSTLDGGSSGERAAKVRRAKDLGEEHDHLVCWRSSQRQQFRLFLENPVEVRTDTVLRFASWTMCELYTIIAQSHWMQFAQSLAAVVAVLFGFLLQCAAMISQTLTHFGQCETAGSTVGLSKNMQSNRRAKSKLKIRSVSGVICWCFTGFAVRS